jgi:hypothetical protein
MCAALRVITPGNGEPNTACDYRESHGYCIKIASSGYTAMKMLEESAVAAVLLEYKHEGVDVEAVACHFKLRV